MVLARILPAIVVSSFIMTYPPIRACGYRSKSELSISLCSVIALFPVSSIKGLCASDYDLTLQESSVMLDICTATQLESRRASD